MANETVAQERGTEYTDTTDIPQWAKGSSGSAPSYPAQTRTYTVATKNWDMTSDYTGAGYAATLTSWTRTELHN